ncbi:hypothetical protein FB451DRAFT_1467745 [Mycena latifolia]|nr:hypothetical protein FB451DRAFT_1467745 [Mycena latifolia]
MPIPAAPPRTRSWRSSSHAADTAFARVSAYDAAGNLKIAARLSFAPPSISHLSISVHSSSLFHDALITDGCVRSDMLHNRWTCAGVHANAITHIALFRCGHDLICRSAVTPADDLVQGYALQVNPCCAPNPRHVRRRPRPALCSISVSFCVGPASRALHVRMYEHSRRPYEFGLDCFLVGRARARRHPTAPPFLAPRPARPLLNRPVPMLLRTPLPLSISYLGSTIRCPVGPRLPPCTSGFRARNFICKSCWSGLRAVSWRSRLPALLSGTQRAIHSSAQLVRRAQLFIMPCAADLLTPPLLPSAALQAIAPMPTPHAAIQLFNLRRSTRRYRCGAALGVNGGPGANVTLTAFKLTRAKDEAAPRWQ